jgi:hypothetical protein
MRFLKYTAIGAAGLLVFAFVLIGILTQTRGTPVSQVIAEGDKGGPPAISDPLFGHTIELLLARTSIQPTMCRCF